jgi:hypothetical protein
VASKADGIHSTGTYFVPPFGPTVCCSISTASPASRNCATYVIASAGSQRVCVSLMRRVGEIPNMSASGTPPVTPYSFSRATSSPNTAVPCSSANPV